MGKLLVRVLVVDDHEHFRRLLCTALKTRPGFQVIGEATDGLEAIRKSMELKPDLVLLDIGLPKLNGIETACCLSRFHPDARIVFVSQNNDGDLVAAALNGGTRGYVWKSNVSSALFPAIEALLR